MRRITPFIFVVFLWVYPPIFSAKPIIIFYPPDYALVTVPAQPVSTDHGIVLYNLPAGLMSQYFSIQGVTGSVSFSGLMTTDNSRPAPRRSALIYGTQSLGPNPKWSAVLHSLPSTVSYVLTLGSINSTLSGILNISNRSEIDLLDAKVEVKIGDGLFSDSGARPMLMKTMSDSTTVTAGGPSHYFYSLTAPVTLLANQVVNIPIFTYDRIRALTIFRFDGGQWGNTDSPVQLNQELVFQNTTGFPIAPGSVQIVADGRLIAVGSIGSIQGDGEARIHFGTAIDVTATRKIFASVVEKFRQETIEINLTNASSKLAIIETTEPCWGTTEIAHASQGYTRLNNRIKFESRLGPKEGQTISVTFRMPAP